MNQMNSTKVLVISSDKKHLDEIANVLKSGPELFDITAVQGEAEALYNIKDVPDVLVVNGRLAERGGLEAIERMGHLHPETAFIIVTENHSSEFLLNAMRAGVREVLPCPIPHDQLKSAISRIRQRAGGLTPEAKVFAFISCKGGAGSTFLATNLGYALAQLQTQKVAYVDLNAQFGDGVLVVSEQRPSTDLATLCREIHRLDAALLEAAMVDVMPNYAVLAAPEDPASAIDIKPQQLGTILKLIRKCYNFAVLDLARSIDALTLQGLDNADAIFPVLQLNLQSIRDAKRTIGVLQSLGYEKSRIKPVVNRFTKTSDITVADAEKSLGLSVCACIPNSYVAVQGAVNHGAPVLQFARKDPVSKSILELARTLTPQSTSAEGGWLSRMFARA
jgi:pilus assembly protein CpaE